jgi:FAD/FMN-containing dehydrogenase
MTRPAPSAATLDRLAAVVGERHALRGGDDMAPYLVEQRNRYFGKAAMVLRPGSTEEVSRLLKIASETGTAIVPQGGNTGLVGAQTPFEHGREVVLSLGRMNRIRAIDPLDNTITVEAGCILATVQAEADRVDRLFPLSLGAEGSCQIGGNLSSNAGGIGVLAYGNARNLVLGLEVVLADGRVWDGLRALRKDNTGYDLRDLFIGAEGTLGIITGAVLRLLPKPRDTATAFIAVPSPAAAVALLSLASEISGNRVTGFELMPRFGLDIVLRHVDGARDPIAGEHPWYVLMELAGGEAEGVLRGPCESVLEAGLEHGLIIDATIAESKAQSDAFWYIRFALAEFQKFEGGSIKHDVSVPVSTMPEFIEEGCAAAIDLIPGCRPLPFGHIGDGNVHFNISQPVGADTHAFLGRWEEMNDVIHSLVLSHNGSISAEHGIGRMKSHMMAAIKSPVELELMRGLKRLFDPDNILNPGKLLPPEEDRS